MFWCEVLLKQPGMRPVGAVDTWVWRVPGDGGVGLIPWCDAQGRCVREGEEVRGPVLRGSCEPWTLQGGQGKDGGVFQKGWFQQGLGDSEVKGDQACKSERILRTV